MIVPRHWSEARTELRVNGKKRVIRRFGWSNESAEDAEAHAQSRALEAAAALAEGQETAPRETRAPYLAGEGLPIREEILSEHGDDVVTRNAYGAACLNSPDVLFADLDLLPALPTGGNLGLRVLIVIAVAGALGAIHPLAAIAGLALGLVWALRATVPAKEAGPSVVSEARERLDAFLLAHPDWRVRLYRTPAGFRLLALHRTFAPDAPEVAEAFALLRTDPIYALLCRQQRCFRARVSPKPWRVGVREGMRPRPGVWPVRPERLPDRTAWVARYTAASEGWAACAFEAELGQGSSDPRALAVAALHDRLSGATSGLPIA